MKLLVINGPNLNLLGKREPGIYGTENYAAVVDRIKSYGRSRGCNVDVVQHSGEGEIIDALHGAMGRYQGVIINPGAYTHYSYAIHDAIKSINIPVIEVHMSNIAAREEFRHRSVVAPACVGQISGLGIQSYHCAVRYFAGLGEKDRDRERSYL